MTRSLTRSDESAARPARLRTVVVGLLAAATAGTLGACGVAAGDVDASRAPAAAPPAATPEAVPAAAEPAASPTPAARADLRTGRRVARSGERPRRAAAGHRTARPPVKKRAAKPHQARRNTHTGPRRPSRPGEPTALEREVIALTNDERENAGCKAVSVDGALQRAAQDYAADMARTGHFDHVGQDGSKPWDRARKAGYKGSFVSENIAMGGDSAVTPPKVVRMWMDSPGHAQNIKRCASTVTGVGRGTKGGRTYWVQMFG